MDGDTALISVGLEVALFWPVFMLRLLWILIICVEHLRLNPPIIHFKIWNIGFQLIPGQIYTSVEVRSAVTVKRLIYGIGSWPNFLEKGSSKQPV